MKEEGKERKLSDGRATACGGAADLDHSIRQIAVQAFKHGLKHGHTVLFNSLASANVHHIRVDTQFGYIVRNLPLP